MVSSEMGLKQYKLLILFLLFILSCNTNSINNVEKTQDNTPSPPEQVLNKFSAYGTKEGKKIWYLTAEKAYVYESKNIALLEKFNVKFFKTDKNTNLPTNQISSVIKSNKGEMDIGKNDFHTIGKTTVITADNEILECEDLKYVDREKKIFTDSSVVITRKDSVIKGKGLEATPDLSSVIVKNNRVEIIK